MTRLVVVDAVFFVLAVAHAVWVSRINRASPIHLFSGRGQPARDRWIGGAVGVVVSIGLVLGTSGSGSGTRTVNLLVFLVAMVAARDGVQVVHNRAVAQQ